MQTSYARCLATSLRKRTKSRLVLSCHAFERYPKREQTFSIHCRPHPKAPLVLQTQVRVTQKRCFSCVFKRQLRQRATEKMYARALALSTDC